MDVAQHQWEICDFPQKHQETTWETDPRQSEMEPNKDI